MEKRKAALENKVKSLESKQREEKLMKSTKK